MNDLIYAFCLTTTLPELNRKEEFSGLRCIASGVFYAVIKMVPESEFSEENLKKNLSDIAWLDTNARMHVKIISMLMEDYTVIPFNFGTIYLSEEPLKKFIGDYADSLIENLLFVEWKEEWAIKLYCNHDVLKEHIDTLSPAAAELERQIMASSPGKAFLLSRKKAVFIENEIDLLCKKYGQEYFDEFKKISHSTALNNIVPKEYTDRKDEMILHAAFLVSKDKAIEFVSVVRQMKNKYAGFGFNVEITGPWPPFSFISIKEKQ